MVPTFQSYNVHLQEETICKVGERFLVIPTIVRIKVFHFLSTLRQS
jgi:hypothetical protein